jgi:hypothetical protein
MRDSRRRTSGSAADKSKTGTLDIERVMRDERVVRLRREGLTYSEISSVEDVGRSTVGDIMKRWLDERGPSVELVEELRALEGDRLDEMQAKYWPHLMRPLRDSDGDVIYEGPEGNRRPVLVPDPAVGQQVLRIMERRARLFGLDMQQSQSGGPQLTREALASLLYGSDEPPIDVEAEEISDDQDARSIAPGD